MPREPYSRVAVIVVNWNGHLLTCDCLESLRKCHYKNFQVIVVDNGSEIESFEYIKARCQDAIILRNEENLGFTGGNNVGVKWALRERFDAVMLLNNDTLVEPDFMGHLVDQLAEKGGVGAVQPKIYFEDDRQRIWNAGGRFDRLFGISRTVGVGQLDVGQFDTACDVDWITGCCMLLSATTLKKVGVLDDSFFAYYEDVDLSLRVRQNRQLLRYEPKSIIYHAVSSASKSESRGKEGYISPHVHFFNVRNHLYLIRKHYQGLGLVLPYLIQLSRVALMLAYFVARMRLNKAKATVKGFVEGHRMTCS